MITKFISLQCSSKKDDVGFHTEPAILAEFHHATMFMSDEEISENRFGFEQTRILTYVLNYVAVVANEEECAAVWKIDLHTNQSYNHTSVPNSCKKYLSMAYHLCVLANDEV